MVLVDITIPSVDKTYDFQLDEDTNVEEIIEAVVDMVGQKERINIVGDTNQLQLCDCNTQSTLFKDWTLREQGVQAGSRLILI